MKCPCCGKEIFDVRLEGDAIEQIKALITRDPASFGGIVVGIFEIMHNVEGNKDWDWNEIRYKQSDSN